MASIKMRWWSVNQLFWLSYAKRLKHCHFFRQHLLFNHLNERIEQSDVEILLAADSINLQRAQELERIGQDAKAELAYRQMLARNPHHADALQLLGLLCFKSGRAREALVLLRQSICARPHDPNLHSDLASLLGTTGRLDEALSELEQVVQLAPGHAPAHNNRGVTLERLHRFEEAAVSFGKAVELQPKNAAFRIHHGNALRKAGAFVASEQAFRQALAIDPASLAALQNLAGLLREQARHEEALSISRRAIELAPDNHRLRSSYLYTIHYHPYLTLQEIFAEHQEWARRHEGIVQVLEPRHRVACSPERRLRIGYVSPDFRRHAVTTFFEPLLSHHDHRRFEITCYSSASRTDDFTERLRHKADRWRDISKVSDDEAARLIRNDQIDILVDLTGHMADNRLLVFARRPAPVQITYVGHPNTTGLRAMDYRMTDVVLDPESGPSDQYHTEKLIRVPGVFGCYQPPEEQLEVPSAPCERNSWITFGCLNNPAKVTTLALELWAQILRSLPDSRLILLGRGSPTVENIFRKQHVDPERVRHIGRLKRADYVKMFGEIDIALDCFPYNGQTTTCDGFWMGVPLVALEGNSYVSRMGLCLLTQVGLEDLVARSTEDYLSICQQLAANRPRLIQTRSDLRRTLLSSRLTDGAALAADIQAAYREAWRQYCRG